MKIAEHVKKNKSCIGCGYCVSFGNGQLSLDGSGFFEPTFHQPTRRQDFEETLVNRSCPGINGSNVFNTTETKEGFINDQYWGQFKNVYVGNSRKDIIQSLGSSGGVLTELALFISEMEDHDGVLVTQYDDRNPLHATSEITNDPAVITRSAGSKYCPSHPLAFLGALRGSPKKYAIIARPCDIATLRRAIDAGDSIKHNISYLISFFCAGTPSVNGNKQLASKMGVMPGQKIIKLKHRGNGWPGETEVVTSDGQTLSCSYNESWGKVLKNHTHRLCKICPDGIGESADIVAADAWYGDAHGYPDFSDKPGRSLVISRTLKGDALLNLAVKNKRLKLESIDVRDIDKMQPGQLARRRQLWSRIFANKLFFKMVPTVNRTALIMYQDGQSVIQKTKTILKTIKKMFD